jgi:hypothetical protein
MHKLCTGRVAGEHSHPKVSYLDDGWLGACSIESWGTFAVYSLNEGWIIG